MTTGFGQLTIINPDGRQSFLLDKPQITIGCAATNDIVIHQRGLGDTHSLVVWESTGCSITDLGSKSGTVVNNRRVERANLATGDLIKLGDITLRFAAGGQAANTSDATIADAVIADQTVVEEALLEQLLPQEDTTREATYFSRQIGRYQITQQVGRGGMAQIFLAQDLQMNRPVAIKLMAQRLQGLPRCQQTFRTEANLLASLHHQAIMPLYDYGEDREQPFLVMPYLPGGTLADKLMDGPMTLSALAPIIGQIADALDAVHAQKIVHQDVKPANILFDADGRAVLADFGVATRFDLDDCSDSAPQAAIDDRAQAKQVVGGTPAYMSPEQAGAIIEDEANGLDGRSDIYALGIIIFEALSGNVPFRMPHSRQTLLDHLTEPVPAISEFNATLPPTCQVAISSIVAKALAKDPNERYQTAKALAQDINQAAFGYSFSLN